MTDTRPRHRMVVEEVNSENTNGIEEIAQEIEKPEHQIVEETTNNNLPIEEKNELLSVVKEKVEELQNITEHISEDVEKSVEVQEEIVEATEKVEPTFQESTPKTYAEPLYAQKRSSGANPLVIIIPGVLLLGALVGGIVFYQRGINQTPAEAPTQTDTPPIVSTAPSATPMATVDFTKYSVIIFNGSGIPGEAGKAKDLITAVGFKVGSTANAATYDFKKTIVKAKSTVEASYLTKLSETLGKTYVMDKAQVLDASSKNDVEVIVGSSKN